MPLSKRIFLHGRSWRNDLASNTRDCAPSPSEDDRLFRRFSRNPRYGLIESAVARASAAFGDTEAYPGGVAKAAAMGCGLAQNHGFIDGNKRIGMAVMLLILRRNGVALHYSQEELTGLGLSVARGDAGIAEIVAWIKSHIV